jgi:glycosyltransferase involved in cell wall biosynthesis
MVAGAERAGLQAETKAEAFDIIRRPYVLVTPISTYVDDAGGVWLERSWHRDLVAHLEYLVDLTLCAPRLPKGSEPDLVRLDLLHGSRLRFVHLPTQTSWLGALLHFPRTLVAIWRAIGRAEIVHSHVHGWPYPLGWIANPIALLRKKHLLVVVESDWRLGTPGPGPIAEKLLQWNALRSWIAKWSCRRAHLAIFTHTGYRDALLATPVARAHVAPAVWVNDADRLDASNAEAGWEAKLHEPVRLLFAGRLVAAKGVGTLLAALRRLDASGAKVHVDVLGRGEDREACLATATELHSVRLRVLEPVPYGAPFHDLLRRYHAVLVPSLTGEQPRILFDANSQAVSVIASGTAGIRPYVVDGETGQLLPAGDIAALASAIERAGRNAGDLCRMGLAALRSSRGFTHQSMHRRRSHLIREFCT